MWVDHHPHLQQDRRRLRMTQYGQAVVPVYSPGAVEKAPVLSRNRGGMVERGFLSSAEHRLPNGNGASQGAVQVLSLAADEHSEARELPCPPLIEEDRLDGVVMDRYESVSLVRVQDPAGEAAVVAFALDVAHLM